jgi:hypothetical protein
LDDLEDIERPTPFLDIQFFEWAEPVVRAAHFARTVRRPVAYDWDAGMDRNFAQQNIAAHPTGASSGRGQRVAAFKR